MKIKSPLMFSPIAHENLNSPHLPDGSAQNASLEKYTAAYDRHFDRLKDFARSRQGGFLVMDHDDDAMKQMARLFEGGRYVA